MTLTWSPTNLERHAAKHYLGNPGEDWRSLGLAPPGAWEAWRQQARDARCRLGEGHPEECPEPERCRVTQRAAAEPYRAGAAADWEFATANDFVVRFDDEQGEPAACGSGPRGVFVVAVERKTSHAAKTAFRPMAEPRTGPDPVLGAVRRMRCVVRAGGKNWSAEELLQVETHLLLRRPGAEGRAAKLAAALRGPS